MAYRKPGHKANNALERRYRIRTLIETIGLYGIRRQARILAEQFQVHPNTINDDVKAVLHDLPQTSNDELLTNLRVGLERAEEETQRILATTTDNKEKLLAARTLGQLAKDRTDLMERWGTKPKIADKVEINASDLIKELLKKKEEKEENKNEVSNV